MSYFYFPSQLILADKESDAKREYVSLASSCADDCEEIGDEQAKTIICTEAAAPDLLEACKAACIVIGDEHPDDRSTKKLLRAAIAKATPILAIDETEIDQPECYEKEPKDITDEADYDLSRE